MVAAVRSPPPVELLSEVVLAERVAVGEVARGDQEVVAEAVDDVERSSPTAQETKMRSPSQSSIRLFLRPRRPFTIQGVQSQPISRMTSFRPGNRSIAPESISCQKP